MLMLNSGAMDVVATPDRLTWRLTGGTLDLCLFMGPYPLQALRQYTRLVGLPQMQPHWAFGFHHGRCVEAEVLYWMLLPPSVMSSGGMSPCLKARAACAAGRCAAP